MEKGLCDGAYMRILLNGKWHVVLEDGTTGQMDLPGTLDENGIGHRDVGANQWHPDAVLGNAAGEIDKDAPIATRFTRHMCVLMSFSSDSARLRYIASPWFVCR